MKHLSTKLVAIMLSICIIGMGALAFTSILMFRSTYISQSLENIQRSTESEAEHINGWVQNHSYYVQALATELSYGQASDLSRQTLLPKLRTHVENSEYFDVYVGLPNGKLIMSTGFEPDYAGGYSVLIRDWYKGAVADISKPYLSPPYQEIETKNICIAASKAIVRDGDLLGVVALDVSLDRVGEIVNQVSVGRGSYAFLVDSEGYILSHPNEDYMPTSDGVFQNLAEIRDGGFRKVWDEREYGKPAKLTNWDREERYYTSEVIDSTGWILYTAIPSSVINEPVRNMILVFLAITALVLGVAVLMILAMVNRIIVKPVSIVTEAALELTKGSVDIQIEHSYNDEMGLLLDTFTAMAHSIKQQVQTTERIASGDLVSEISIRSETDIMSRSLNRLIHSLNRIISDISGASMQVAAGSQEISGNTQMLAQGATEQAAAIHQLSDSISEIVEKMRSNEEKNRASGAASRDVVENAQESSAQMQQMLAAVNEINEACASISNVIKVIEDIAFQTKILSLNAAVEAARAGAHGKGFAAVADEVRNLAAKSAEAAQETGQLIANSINRAMEGAVIANKTCSSLQGIIESVGKATTLVDEISAATEEQSDAIRNIYDGIEQINKVVHNNATNSEECAAAAHALFEEATTLMRVVRQFQVEGESLTQAFDETDFVPFVSEPLQSHNFAMDAQSASKYDA